MQVQRIQNNNYKLPCFNGKLTLIDVRKLPPFDRVIVKEIPPEADKVLYDEFVKLTGKDMKRFLVGFGLHDKDNRYTEFLKKIKEISGIDTEKISLADEKKMFGYSYNKNDYQIGIHEENGIILKHEADFLKL